MSFVLAPRQLRRGQTEAQEEEKEEEEEEEGAFRHFRVPDIHSADRGGAGAAGGVCRGGEQVGGVAVSKKVLTWHLCGDSGAQEA